MSLPDWLARRLADDNPDGITRAARLGTCRSCGHPVLRGLDGDACAMAVTITPIELDAFGEYLALARGIRTFHLTRRFNASGATRWEIDLRWREDIRTGHRRYAVVPQHRCGAWLPHNPDGVLARMKPPSADYDGPPPF